ncbi:MAG TPA: ABC transporter substrate-binding protein [Ktedonobacteraceae bacterium]|nr:ABC transporter substrate-binding protein [Ktedonobacteraceae bacterium]
MFPYRASSPHRYHSVAALVPLLLVLSMLLAACGGSAPTTTTAPNRATVLRVLSAPGQPNPDFFNPFFNTNQGGAYGAQGLLHETLYFTNLYNGQTQPWLAASYSYSSDLTQLTFKMRPGVTWNDGQPLTSADAKFTFDLMKAHPALDQGGVLPLIKSVATPDSSTVVFTLQRPYSTALFRIGSTVFIVPQHIWSKISGDPARFTNDKDPVGTGPYKLTSFNTDLITYDVNPTYWGTRPQVKTIQVPSIKDNTTAITNMIQGKLDWMGTGWNPSYDPLYTAKDPQHNRTWFAASNTVMLYLNLQKAPFNNLLVRKAINAAINRDQLPQGVATYAKVAHPTGVVIPPQKDWIASPYQDMTFQYNISQAQGYLQQAGFTKGSDGFYRDSSGKVFTMTVDVVNGWSDWDQDVQFIVNDLNKAGIKATVNSQSGYTPYYNALSGGNYDAAISWTNVGPTPYYAYQAMLSSTNSAPKGSSVVGTNFGRWDASTSNGYSAKTDALLRQYEATTDVNAQKQAIAGIEDIMVNQLPTIPLTVNVNWNEYTTKNWVGWPDESNPYDYGAPFQMPDAENVILHLTPATS